MNELCTRISSACSGDIITLEPNQIYHVRQDDSFSLSGYFCTNSARQDENPNGTRFCAIFLEDKKDIVIDGNGATILVHGKMTTILLNRCENITIKNLTIDYACPTMTECTVLENCNGIVTMRIHPDCRFRADGNQLYWRGEDGFYGVLGVCAILTLAAVGVYILVKAAIPWEGYRMLLEEGDYNRAAKRGNRQYSGIYWGLITAAYLAVSFLTQRWDMTWIIWPVAAVLYGVIVEILKLRGK